MGDPFNGVSIRKVAGVVHSYEFLGFQTRNASVVKLVTDALNNFGIKECPEFFVNTCDFTVEAVQCGGKHVFSFMTWDKNFVHVCPDFTYNNWKQVGVPDYEHTRTELMAASAPETDLMGWRGQLTGPWVKGSESARDLLIKYDNKKNFDFELINWIGEDANNQTTTPNFLSMVEQVKRWRYLIDVEGNGWSGRLKFLLSAPRVVFIQDRPSQEDFFQWLKPWVHYVPVKRDLSDLQEKIDLLKEVPLLEQTIIANTREFSNMYLTRSAALKRWAKLIHERVL